jgi:hypothetical protein
MVPCYWACAFFTANIYNIFWLLQERQMVELDEWEEDVYVHHFLPSGMRPKQFIRLMDASKKRVIQPGVSLMKQGQRDSTNVYLLLKGKCHVIIDGTNIADVSGKEPMCFLGEISLLEHEKKLGLSQRIPTIMKGLKHHKDDQLDIDIKVEPIQQIGIGETHEECTEKSSATVTAADGEQVIVLEWSKVREDRSYGLCL